MSKMAKEYVLVPREEYDRKYGKNAPPNPFINPSVNRAKEKREKMMDVVSDKNIAPEDANMLIQNLLASYRRDVSDVLKPSGEQIRKPAVAPTLQKSDAGEHTQKPEAGSTRVFPVKVRALARKPATDKAKLKFSTPSRADIEQTKNFMGGVLNAEDAFKAASLLKNMTRAGMIESDWGKGATLPSGRKIKATQLKKLVRDAYVNAPDKRGLPQGVLESFSQTLAAEGIVTDHAPRKIRKTSRPKPYGNPRRDL